MLKKLRVTSFLICGYFLFAYPSKKENTYFFDYCYSLEKIIARNSVEKSTNLSNNFKTFAKDITLFGSNNTKGALANKIIDQYKSSKKFVLINFLPNQLYCFLGYWIEEFKPGTFISIFYEKSQQRIDQFKDTKKNVDELIKDINSEYNSIKKNINNLF